MPKDVMFYTHVNLENVYLLITETRSILAVFIIIRHGMTFIYDVSKDSLSLNSIIQITIV